MDMQIILNKIRSLKISKISIEKKINDINRVDSITINYRKTKDILGNSGIPEASDAYSVIIGKDTYNADMVYPEIFESMKSLYLEKLKERYNKCEEKLKFMEEKKNNIEDYIDSIMKQDEI